jgi:hypothetical protein
MKNSKNISDTVRSLQEELGDALLAVALGDVRSMEFDPTYVKEDAGETWDSVEEFFSDETQKEIFENIAAETFFETGEGSARSPLGFLRFTVRNYEEAIIVIGWRNSSTVVVTLRPDPEHIPPTIQILEETLEVEETEERT